MDADRPAATSPAVAAECAAIGDGRTLALVAPDGTLAWLALPRADGPPLFDALRGGNGSGGAFVIRPTGAFEATRRYLPGTNVLETTFTTPSGSCVLRDLFVVAPPGTGGMRPERELLREVEGLDGEVELAIDYAPRAALRDRGPLGLWSAWAGRAVVLRSDAPLAPGEDGAARGTHVVRGGEPCWFSLVEDSAGPAVLPPLGEHARRRLEETAAWWRGWSARLAYDGPYRDAVERAALALALLVHAPTGAIVAGPHDPVCRLTDAAATLRALWSLDLQAEAEAFTGWLLHATRLSWPELHASYRVDGRPSAERAPALAVYGEVAGAALQLAERGGRLDREARGMLRGIAQVVMRGWREQAGEPRATLATAQAWSALDRLIALHDRYGLELPLFRVQAERTTIRAELETRGYSERLASFAATIGGEHVASELLALPATGFVEPAHARMRATVERVLARLGAGPLVRASERPGAPASVAAGFRAVEALARGGEPDAAEERFTALLALANDVGLPPEEVDIERGTRAGELPARETLVALINAAVALREVREGPIEPQRLRNRAEAEARSGPRARMVVRR